MSTILYHQLATLNIMYRHIYIYNTYIHVNICIYIYTHTHISGPIWILTIVTHHSIPQARPSSRLAPSHNHLLNRRALRCLASQLSRKKAHPEPAGNWDVPHFFDSWLGACFIFLGFGMNQSLRQFRGDCLTVFLTVFEAVFSEGLRRWPPN